MIKHYLKISLRNLWKNKTQTAVGIGGLSIGFIIFTVAFYWIHFELNYDSFHKDPDRIYLVNSVLDKDNTWSGTPTQLHESLKGRLPETESVGGKTTLQDAKLILGNETKDVNALGILGDFFELFPQKFITGNKPDINAREAIISEKLAKQLYNSTDVIGEHIYLDIQHPYYIENQSFRITGVVEDHPKNTTLPFDVIFWNFPNRNDGWSNFHSSTYIKLRKGINPDEFAPKLKDFETGGRKRDFGMVPLNRAKYMGEGKSFWKAYNFLIIVAFVGALLLISALFNHIVLTTTGIMARIKESALRKTVGAQAKDIFGLFYSEIAISFIIVLLLSSFFFFPLRESISDFTGIVMDGMSFYSIVITLWLVCLVISLIFSIYPIWRIYKRSIHQSIIKSKNHFRKVVLTLQIGICALLLFSLTEMGRQFYFMNKTDLGFQRENILELKVPISAENLATPLINEIKSSQYIQDATLFKFRFFKDGFYSYVNNVFDDDSDKKLYVTPVPIHFVNFFGLKIVQGSDFDPNNTAVNQAIVNEKVIRDFQIDSIIGKTIKIRGVDLQIIGILKDFHTHPMSAQIFPNIFVINMDNMWGNKFIQYYIKHTPGKEKETRQAIAAACEKVLLPQTPVELITFDEYVGSFYQSEKRMMQIFGVIAAACLIICLLGVYAMVSLTTRQRQREIAIRKVNGAGNKDIFRKLLKEYIIITTIACIIALPPAYIFVMKWLEAYAYKIELGAESILIIISIMCLVIFTVVQKIIKATRANPAESLKAE